MLQQGRANWSFHELGGAHAYENKDQKLLRMCMNLMSVWNPSSPSLDHADNDYGFLGA